jgi:hypothetical protein
MLREADAEAPMFSLLMAERFCLMELSAYPKGYVIDDRLNGFQVQDTPTIDHYPWGTRAA